ncbi:hypothetical protein PG996_016069 [Apiospora saccharicola]|uniref:C2H2-type domain-containing protein n=1 Tax=Apiospora saccharicola TaxID=335842 RepID=A0ABR1TQ42_9PEZI
MSFKPLPASSVIPGHIRADGRFVCDVPLANGELCGTDLKNDGDSIRSHKHKCKKHPDYKPETRKMPFAESQHGKKTPARTTSCVHCDNAVECKTPYSLVTHYRANPETHNNLRTEAEIFASYPQLRLELHTMS